MTAMINTRVCHHVQASESLNYWAEVARHNDPRGEYVFGLE
jgi:hypothetical protein